MNQKKFDEARGILSDLLVCRLDHNFVFRNNITSENLDADIYKAAKKLVAAYEKISDEDIKEMSKMPFQVMPLPKSRTQIDVEIDRCDYGEVRQIIKKICEDHEGKRDLHITVSGLVFDISDAEEYKCDRLGSEVGNGIKSAIKKELDETFSRCASKIDGGLATKVALEVLQEVHTEKTAQEQSPR